jgi:anaerobic magnesium-protoporphyrin IX monomethyl ester cyclase
MHNQGAARILLINPPHPSLGSRIPGEHLPPLGLLSIGGPLVDDGHTVKLLDCEFGPMPLADIIHEVTANAPNAILIGHSGTTSAHPAVVAITRAIRHALPRCTMVYGGAFPSYHWQEVLAKEPQIDVIVRGEGEETTRRLIRAIESHQPLHGIPGLAYRHNGAQTMTAPAAVIDDLDAYRVGWELIDPSHYTYWGGRRAVVVQFSRGCPHTCTYCGQRGFWTKWRHRDPIRFAAEVARLNREYGIEIFNLADENPTTSKRLWRMFLEALVAESIHVALFATIRASDIVRDADMLSLYRQAGMTRILLGMEHTDEETLRRIRKGSSTATDREAVRLLRRHGILSMISFVAGFGEERDGDYWRVLRQLLSYDPDLVQTFHATPHAWTPYAQSIGERRVVQTDLKFWDYKHQVLATPYVRPWRVFLWLKAIELGNQLRPRALFRLVTRPDRQARRIMAWHYRIGFRVLLNDLRDVLRLGLRLPDGPRLRDFWALSLDATENAMQNGRMARNHSPGVTATLSPTPPRH